MRTRAPLDPGLDVTEVAERLRPVTFRLARLLRQQDERGVAPALVSALATIDREGPLTLGDLAAREQLTPPSITKVVAALEAQGFVERVRDEDDRRVHHVEVTAKGHRFLQASRSRRTEWLAHRLGQLSADEVARLAAALDTLEELVSTPDRATPDRAAPEREET